jgi:Ca2+-binding EF-hand superfamily protein
MKDGELDKEEVLEGMNKLLGKDVLEEWNMFENFFAYIDTDGNGTIDRDEFSEFVTTKPEVQTIRRQSQQYESPKQVFENFHGTFQGDKHKSGQKAFGNYSARDGKQKTYYNERTNVSTERW